jgi:hypothetical protein
MQIKAAAEAHPSCPAGVHRGMVVSGGLSKAAILLVFAAALGGWTCARAADPPGDAFETPADRPSSLVIGNYCGLGRRSGDFTAPAVDRVDLICRAHDVCYETGRDRCDCNRELIGALGAYLATHPPDRRTRRRARLVRAAIRAMTPYCHVFPHGLHRPHSGSPSGSSRP